MSDTGSRSQPDDALVDLLVKQATEGLSPAEQRELDALDVASATEALRGLERTAAAITLAAQPAAPSLPAALRERIERDAAAYFAARGPTFAGRPAAGTPGAARPGGSALGWFAAAACLVLALIAWFRPPMTSSGQVASRPAAPVQVPQPPPVVPTAEQERSALLARQDTLKVVLGATKDPGATGVTADAVWDPVTHKGFLHFVGLVANDPAVRQYQIWIFDGGRDKRYPVDGGVFDVPANTSEVVIPIRADLPIRQAKGFAVTAEQPGGVVVSGLKHVLVLGMSG